MLWDKIVPRFRVEIANALGHALEPMIVDAGSELEAARYAYSQGGVPVSIRLMGDGVLGRLRNPIGASSVLGTEAQAIFFEQLAEMLRSGLTLEQGLQVLSIQDANGKPAKLAHRLLRRIREGAPLSTALSQESGVSTVFIGVVKGAEQGGALAEGLGALSSYLERQLEINRRISSALAYPAVVLVIALFAVYFILAVVMPEFAPMFLGEEKRLPAITRGILWLSALVDDGVGPILLVLVGMLGGGYVVVRNVASIRSRLIRASTLLPPVRYAFRLDLARSIQVLGLLLSNGVEASEAMSAAADVASREVNRTGLRRAAARIREGASISSTLSTLGELPKSAASLISVGEHAGEIGRMVLRAAQFLESDTNRRIDKFLAVLNPAAVISLGVLIAGLIAGVMVGILSISQLALR